MLAVKTLSKAQYFRKLSRIPHTHDFQRHRLPKMSFPPHFSLNDINCCKDIVNQKLWLAFEQFHEISEMCRQCRHPHLTVVVSEMNGGIQFTIDLGNGFKVMDTSYSYIPFSRKKCFKMQDTCGTGWKESSVKGLENHWPKSCLEKSRNRQDPQLGPRRRSEWRRESIRWTKGFLQGQWETTQASFINFLFLASLPSSEHHKPPHKPETWISP